jgi:hypothetical protein
MLSSKKLKLFREKVQSGCVQERGSKIILTLLNNVQQNNCMAHHNYSVHHDWHDGPGGRYHKDWLDHKDYK